MKNREIKFRIFTKRYDEKGQMIYLGNGIKQRYDYEDGFVYAFSVDEYPDFNGHEKYADNEPFEVMQFTGLKDKNGKDIYEGDIVKNQISGYVTKVIFEDGMFTLPALYSIPSQRLSTYPVEVIGNIYETPELI